MNNYYFCSIFYLFFVAVRSSSVEVADLVNCFECSGLPSTVCETVCRAEACLFTFHGPLTKNTNVTFGCDYNNDHTGCTTNEDGSRTFCRCNFNQCNALNITTDPNSVNFDNTFRKQKDNKFEIVMQHFEMSPSDNSSELSSSSSEESDELENIGIDTHSGIKIPPSTPRIMNGNITVTKANNTLVPEFNKYKDAVSDGTIIIGNLDLIEEELATGKKAVKNNENNVSSEIKPKIPKSFASERWSRDVSQKKVPTVKNVTAVEYPKAWAAWISLDDEEGAPKKLGKPPARFIQS